MNENDCEEMGLEIPPTKKKKKDHEIRHVARHIRHRTIRGEKNEYDILRPSDILS